MADRYNIAAGQDGTFNSFWQLGFNTSVGTTEETVWDEGGIYAPPSSATQVSVSSSSADDDAAGIGARSVTVVGLDSDSKLLAEDVIMDGQNGVTTSSSFTRVFRLIVLTAGSSGENEGELYVGEGTITAGVPATVYARALAGRNRSLMAVWTAPLDKRTFLQSLFVTTQGIAGARAQIRLVVRPPGGVFATEDDFFISQAGGPTYVNHDIPIPIPRGADIEIRARSADLSIDVSAGMQFLIRE